MIEPIEFDLDLYKGATFDINFRIKEDCVAIDVSSWDFYFKAISKETPETTVLEASTTTSPAGINIDVEDDYLVTISFSANETSDISEKGQIYFEIDAVPSIGVRERRWIGNINLFEAA